MRFVEAVQVLMQHVVDSLGDREVNVGPGVEQHAPDLCWGLEVVGCAEEHGETLAVNLVRVETRAGKGQSYHFGVDIWLFIEILHQEIATIRVSVAAEILGAEKFSVVAWHIGRERVYELCDAGFDSQGFVVEPVEQV